MIRRITIAIATRMFLRMPPDARFWLAFDEVTRAGYSVSLNRGARRHTMRTPPVVPRAMPPVVRQLDDYRASHKRPRVCAETMFLDR